VGELIYADWGRNLAGAGQPYDPQGYLLVRWDDATLTMTEIEWRNLTTNVKVEFDVIDKQGRVARTVPIPPGTPLTTNPPPRNNLSLRVDPADGSMSWDGWTIKTRQSYS
jgi:hypothetical protein